MPAAKKAKKATKTAAKTTKATKTTKMKKAIKPKKMAKPAKKAVAKKTMKSVKKTKAVKTVKSAKTTKSAKKMTKTAKPKAAKKSLKSAKKSTKKVNAIPKGYNSITPYLMVDHGMNAIEFYKKAFGAKLVSCMGKENGKVDHAELQIGDSRIMLSDMNDCGGCGEHHEHEADSNVSIHLYIKDVDSVVARAVAAGAILVRPLENMYYGDRSAGLEDPFGHIWHVSTHIEDVTPAEMKKRMQALMAEEANSMMTAEV